MEHLFTSESIISFIVLVILEVVLGIDNVIFVSIIMNRLRNAKDHKHVRRIWMVTGIISRSLLLMALGWLLAQKGKYIVPERWFGKGFDLASLVMLFGGLFLIYKSVKEIHTKLEGEDPNVKMKKSKRTFDHPGYFTNTAYRCRILIRQRDHSRWYGKAYRNHDSCSRCSHDRDVPVQSPYFSICT